MSAARLNRGFPEVPRAAGAAPLTGRAYAKINLGLRVLGRRRDGYHDLETCFQTLALHDRLEVAAAPAGCRVTVEPAGAIPAAANTLTAAFAALADRVPLPGGVRVRVEKRIPVGAGLGGGSSDAAVLLLALRRLYHLTLPDPILEEVAGTVGADVPFFRLGGTARGTGRGECLEPLEDLPPTWVVLGCPPVRCDTGAVYAAWSPSLTGSASGDTITSLIQRVQRREAFTAVNDLEPAAVSLFPEIAQMKQAMVTGDALGVAMSGSGASVYGLYAAQAEAGADHDRWRRQGLPVRLTRLLSRREYQATVIAESQAES